MNNSKASCWPIVMRELRTEARKPANRWLRFLAAALSITVYVGILFSGAHQSSELGKILFRTLNAILLAMIVLLVPLLTADCISSERRQGTLGLLFLTPLRPMQIILGKSLIHGIRASSIFMAIVPLLAMPLLLGGVSGKEIIIELMIDSSAMFLALAAGIISSSCNRKLMSALAGAEFLGVCCALFLFIFNASVALAVTLVPSGSGFISYIVTLSKMIATSYHDRPLADFFIGSFAFNAGLVGNYRSGFEGWEYILSTCNSSQQTCLFACLAGALTISALALMFGMSYAARRMRLVWREPPPSAMVQKMRKTFCTPIILKKAFHKEMKGLLERDPIGWAQRSSWRGRIGGLCWCLAFIFLETFFLGIDVTLRNLHFGQFLLLHILFMGMAFNAAGSFQLERDSGLMELILITPLSVNQIIKGRVWALWAQFCPAAIVVTLVSAFILDNRGLFPELIFYFGEEGNHEVWNSPLLFAFGSYFLIPIVGLYYSQLRIHFIAAWGATLMFGFVLPLITGAILMRTSPFGNECMAVTQLVLGCLYWSLLYQNLSRRSFSNVVKAAVS